MELPGGLPVIEQVTIIGRAGWWPAAREQTRTSKGFAVEIQAAKELTAKKCVPCEGGVDPCPLPQAQAQLTNLNGWYLTHEGQRIRKDWETKDFMAALRFFEKVAEVSEAEGHHPDLHLEGYRKVSIEIWTHAIGGLSENDFILAAKIDQLPIERMS
jgi:4a-hydroxytetrahydrobiopterin dehydratase